MVDACNKEIQYYASSLQSAAKEHTGPKWCNCYVSIKVVVKTER